MVVYCHKCKRNIGTIEFVDDTHYGKKSIVRYHELNGLLSSRRRFDGEWGFECDCGNDSRKAEAEQGIITHLPPSAADLDKVRANLLQKKTKKIVTKDGVTVDGFTLKQG